MAKYWRRIAASAMRAAAALAFAAAPGAATSPATYRNPILFADYSDPDVIRVGHDYYLVASSFHLSPGLPVLHSRDLVHWRIIGHVLPKLDFAPEYDLPGPFALDDTRSKPVTGTRYGGGVWAPAIGYHAGKFFVYWPTPDEGIFMATAHRPEGPWSKPVQVIAGPGYEDPCPFWDDDGTAWLVHGKVGAGPLILHRMSADGTRVLDGGRVIVEDNKNLPVLEGPKLYKRHGWYYILAPIGGVDKGVEVALRARDIRGPYQSRVVLRQGETAVQGPHQGGWIETPSGQGWFIHFNSTGAFGRIDYLEPLRWQNDWPVIGKPIRGDTAGEPVDRWPMPNTGSPPTHDRLQASDDFTRRTLGLQWSWNHNPDNSAWSLTARPGYLRLTALPAQHLVTARDTLTQVLQGPGSRITARVDISHMADGERGGLSLFGVRPSWIGVLRTGGTSRITLASAGDEQPGPVVLAPVVLLRAIVAADQTVRYSYSLDDGRSYQPIGGAIALARFSWWKGARPALFAYNVLGKGGSIDIDWFQVDHPWPARAGGD